MTSREGFESRFKTFQTRRVSFDPMSASNLKSIAAAWPADPFRPNMQLKTFFESLATHPRLSPAVVQSARVLVDNGVQHRVSPSSLTQPVVSQAWFFAVPSLQKDLGASVDAQTL
ncbi:hypothetical protein J3R82DRAFT_8764 [Butyriboletus roseoflavus]|nr:hypothetical protein J3R82DRAFT_8764 [Butyriboletus roseoflavus]